ncbi:MAG: phage holin family protein [Solirubrobacteraceae bacterium]
MPAENGRPESFAATVTEVSERVSVLIREEIELAKAEMAVKVASIARGAALVAAGAVFGVFALVIALLTLAWGLNSAFGSLWEGFAVVLVLLVVLMLGALLVARRLLRVGAPTPKMAIDEAKKIRATVAAKPGAER